MCVELGQVAAPGGAAWLLATHSGSSLRLAVSYLQFYAFKSHLSMSAIIIWSVMSSRTGVIEM